MIKKIAILSSILLTGCSMFSSHDDTVKMPDNGSVQQASSEGMNNSSAQQPAASSSSTANTQPENQPLDIQQAAATQSDSVKENTETKPTAGNTEKVAAASDNDSSTESGINLPKAAVNTTSKSPIIVMDNSILAIQSLLEKNADKINNNPKELKVIIDKYLLPNIDTNRIAAMMLGPKWRTATATQKTEFINQFLTLLTGLYAKNVAKVGQYSVSFNNLPESSWKDQKYVQVTGIIRNENSNSQGSNITVYIISQDGKWLIYDIAVEGISIMQNYQSQFRPISNMEEAIDGVKRVNARSQG
jgi:phospholipid transport system substrate-binding protein